MTGLILDGDGRVRGLLDPVLDGDATSKQWVESRNAGDIDFSDTELEHIVGENVQAALESVNQALVDIGDSVPGFAGDEVATQEATTSTSFTDLTTPGPAVTIDVPASGKVLVTLSAFMWGSGAGVLTSMNLAASGANTHAAADTWGGLDAESRSAIANSWAGSGHGTAERTFLLTGLAPGSTTFTAKYATSSGTSTIRNRVLTVVAEGI